MTSKIEYQPISLEGYFNNKGFTSLSELLLGDLSISGSSLPKEPLAYDDCWIAAGEARFKLSLDGPYDNICADSQSIEINRYARKIKILGLSCQGDYLESFEVLFDDGERKEFLCGFTDFLSVKPYFNDVLAYRSDYVHTRTGVSKDLKMSLWCNEIAIQNTRKIKRITMPSNIFLHIFAVSIA